MGRQGGRVEFLMCKKPVPVEYDPILLAAGIKAPLVRKAKGRTYFSPKERATFGKNTKPINFMRPKGRA